VSGVSHQLSARISSELRIPTDSNTLTIKTLKDEEKLCHKIGDKTLPGFGLS
jgi:hypothetical protein